VKRHVNFRPEAEAGHSHALPGAPGPHDADVPAPLHAPDEYVGKKVENHAAAVALSFMYYNFASGHQNFRVIQPLRQASRIVSGRSTKW
jgi:hypothetical protein